MPGHDLSTEALRDPLAEEVRWGRWNDRWRESSETSHPHRSGCLRVVFAAALPASECSTQSGTHPPSGTAANRGRGDFAPARARLTAERRPDPSFSFSAYHEGLHQTSGLEGLPPPSSTQLAPLIIDTACSLGV